MSASDSVSKTVSSTISDSEVNAESLQLINRLLADDTETASPIAAWIAPGWLPQRSERAALRQAEAFVTRAETLASSPAAVRRTRGFSFSSSKTSTAADTTATTSAVGVVVSAYRTYRRLQTVRSSLSWLGFGASALLSIGRAVNSVGGGGWSNLSPGMLLSLAWKVTSVVLGRNEANSGATTAVSPSTAPWGVEGIGRVYWLLLGGALGVALCNEARWWAVDAANSRDALTRAKQAARTVRGAAQRRQEHTESYEAHRRLWREEMERRRCQDANDETPVITVTTAQPTRPPDSSDDESSDDGPIKRRHATSHGGKRRRRHRRRGDRK